ncbi:MAG: biotin transporter BioY [Clostridia bacterium]|nr:biotin transporter BioY [Clostridia bacterium]
MSNSRSSARDIAVMALFAALTAVCSQIQIPLPYVPINLALFSVHLCGALLGSRRAALAQTVYLLLGLIGLPVFAGFTGGPGILFGKTGGYLIGYVLAALIDGHIASSPDASFISKAVHMLIGTFVCYLFGTIWFMVLTKMSLMLSLTYCVIPFIPGDLIKIVLACLLSTRLAPQLRKLGLA